VEIDISEVKRWISDHPESVRNSKDVGLHFNVDVETLRKKFLRSDGTSLAHFIRTNRISIAASLLCTTNLRWYEIVDRLSFGRPENASRTFKREMGVKVREYRSWFGGSPTMSLQTRRGNH